MVRRLLYGIWFLIVVSVILVPWVMLITAPAAVVSFGYHVFKGGGGEDLFFDIISLPMKLIPEEW